MWSPRNKELPALLPNSAKGILAGSWHWNCCQVAQEAAVSFDGKHGMGIKAPWPPAQRFRKYLCQIWILLYCRIVFSPITSIRGTGSRDLEEEPSNPPSRAVSGRHWFPSASSTVKAQSKMPPTGTVPIASPWQELLAHSRSDTHTHSLTAGGPRAKCVLESMLEQHPTAQQFSNVSYTTPNHSGVSTSPLLPPEPHWWGSL